MEQVWAKCYGCRRVNGKSLVGHAVIGYGRSDWSLGMGGASAIEWTDATWNPIAGCTAISPGCFNCYAARLALRLERFGGRSGEKYRGTARRSSSGRAIFTGTIRVDEAVIDAPKFWRRARRVFVNSMSDVFHESVPDELIMRLFRVMAESPRHTFQVLTKRPQRALGLTGQLPWAENIWLGTSVESDEYYWRIGALQAIVDVRVRFLSCEPLLGSLPSLPLDGIDWVIVGGESGPGARPMDPAWVQEIQEQCGSKSIAFFFKQWGGVNKKRTGRLLGGKTWDEMPTGREAESGV